MVATAIKERPILFQTEMVKAILDGRKTMTRRIVKMRDGSLMEDEDLSNHIDGSFDYVMDFSKTFPYWKELKCPYGEVEDILWVKETFMPLTKGFAYRADGLMSEKHPAVKWKSPRFMPKAAARIWLEITDIKVERLQDISEEDAIKEGIEWELDIAGTRCRNYKKGATIICLSTKESFKSLWQSINGEESWNENPFCWCISFKVLSTNGKPDVFSI